MKMTLLDALRHIQQCGPSGNIEEGICHNADLLMFGEDGQDWTSEELEPDACDRLMPYFKTWPEYSGSPAYPVSLAGFNTPSGAYWSHAGKNKWEGEYGAARRRLLDHCVLQLELLECPTHS